MNKDQIPVGQAKDLTGQQFGNLIALYRISNVGRNTRWRCQCNCEQKTIIDVYTSNLTRGHTTSCGCQQKKRVSQTRTINEIGNRYGKLVVIKEGKGYTSPSGGKHKTWLCKCDCGNLVDVVGTSLRKGLTKSCGCLHKELISQHWEDKILNRDYPNLKVLKRIDSTNEMSNWLCQCKFCNNTFILPTSRLQTSQGCGCQTTSSGVRKILDLLNKNNISYTTEKTFNTCIFPKTNRKARFDFWVNNQYLIEFDGLQHFKANGGWSNEEALKETQKRDNFKNQWCKKNNIPLIRIPYWQENNLTIKDLLLETTNFLYKE